MPRKLHDVLVIRDVIVVMVPMDDMLKERWVLVFLRGAMGGQMDAEDRGQGVGMHDGKGRENDEACLSRGAHAGQGYTILG